MRFRDHIKLTIIIFIGSVIVGSLAGAFSALIFYFMTKWA